MDCAGDHFNLSGVDTDPDIESYPADCGADFERRLHRARSAVEHHQESVTSSIYLGSAVMLDNFPDERVMAIE
jgi:hypothetical protein